MCLIITQSEHLKTAVFLCLQHLSSAQPRDVFTREHDDATDNTDNQRLQKSYQPSWYNTNDQRLLKSSQHTVQILKIFMVSRLPSALLG